MVDINIVIKQRAQFPFALGQRADLFEGIVEAGTGNIKKVAIKGLRLSLSDTEGRQNLRQSIDARAHVWLTLNHPNVVPFFGVSYDYPHAAAIILPYYVNGNALGYVKTNPNVKILPLLSETAAGLAYLHHKGIIHGDIRGTNVLITDDRRAVLADYDFYAVRTAAHFTTTDIAGPVRWQAPEVFLSEDNTVPFTRKTDIFSFAMLAVELITRDKPFAERKADTIAMGDIIHGRRPSPPPGSADAEKIWPLLERCWEQDAENRPTISAVCTALEHM